MIVSFTLENWMSFRDPVTFSMVASRERQHGDRVPRIRKYNTRVLPIAAIYGGNASGKTNFFKALSFAQSLVVKGVQPDSPIPVEPFRLGPRGADLPSRFVFELLVDETIYEFSFAVTRKAVLQEKLVQVTSTREKVLYDRHGDEANFENSLETNQFIQFAFKGTRDNQLFLTNTVSQKVDEFCPVYNWFKESLELVAPDSRFGPFEQFLDKEHPLYATMNEMLLQLDTGIGHLGSEEVPFDHTPIPDHIKAKIQEEIADGDIVNIQVETTNDRYVITRKDGELVSRKLVAFHTREEGPDVKFEMHHESDGSQRVIDLLPAFLMLSTGSSKKVFIIDEVDRSLHTLLTRRLLEFYLASCSHESRSQLLVTTHDVSLMDQRLLRRDEMWVTERETSGSTTLVSFSDYKDVRYDKDIRKSYLQGRMGGIPQLLVGAVLRESKSGEDNEGGN